MFRFSKNKKKSNTVKKDLLFYGEGIIDVTNFDAMSPNDSFGYLCGCDISVFQNGEIEICSVGDSKEVLECFSVLNIVRASNNINNYDPRHDMEVAVTTENKDLRISFQTKESKTGFWKALTTTYDNLK